MAKTPKKKSVARARKTAPKEDGIRGSGSGVRGRKKKVEKEDGVRGAGVGVRGRKKTVTKDVSAKVAAGKRKEAAAAKADGRRGTGDRGPGTEVGGRLPRRSRSKAEMAQKETKPQPRAAVPHRKRRRSQPAKTVLRTETKSRTGQAVPQTETESQPRAAVPHRKREQPQPRAAVPHRKRKRSEPGVDVPRRRRAAHPPAAATTAQSRPPEPTAAELQEDGDATEKAKAGEVFVARGAPLPAAYDENRMAAIARDPEHVFIYWDVQSAVRVADRPLMVRIFCVEDDLSFEFHPPADAGNWYFQVTPGRTYRFELLAREEDGGWTLLSRSREVTTPVRHAGAAGAPDATQQEAPPVRMRALPPEMPLATRAATTSALTPPATVIPDAQMLAAWRARAREAAEERRRTVDGGRRATDDRRRTADGRRRAGDGRPGPGAAESSRTGAAAALRRAGGKPAPAPVPVRAPVEVIFGALYAQGGSK